MSCDSKQGSLLIDNNNREEQGVESIGKHNIEHTLVRCQPLVDGDDAALSVEDRLARVEKLLESMLQTFGGQKIENA
jgi:hypothetical protein